MVKKSPAEYVYVYYRPRRSIMFQKGRSKMRKDLRILKWYGLYTKKPEYEGQYKSKEYS